MEPSELDSFSRTLNAMLKEATRPSINRDDIVIEAAADAVDHSQRVAELDLTIHQIETKFNRAQSIKLALDRIADGSYGSCLRCDGDISLKRLHAVPWTAYCVHCQEITDKERAEPEENRLHVLRHLKDVA